MNLEQLEADCIASRWDPAHLAVYADALQSAGDPRGELIALDLHAELNGPTRESDERRLEILATWLGDLRQPAVRCVWGFLELALDRTVSDAHLLPKLLASPAGPYLRCLEIYGDQRFIRDTTSLLTIAPRPRLAGLAITQFARADQTTIAGTSAAVLLRTLPALETLVLRGENTIIGSFPHPKLRRLRVAGWNALGSLAGEGPPLPAVEDLDFVFDRNWTLNGYPRPRPEQLERLLRGVPALSRLDLSRHDFGNTQYLPRPTIDLFGFLRTLALKRKLTHLRVPSLGNEADVENLQATIDRMPDLVELEITHLIVPPPNSSQPALDLFHSARIIKPPSESEWGPRTHVRGRDTLAVDIPYHSHRLAVELLPAVVALETSYRRIKKFPRSAWDRIWVQLDALLWDRDPTPASIDVSAALLAEAAASVDDPRWRALASALRARRLAPDAVVRVQRLWSY